MKFTLNHTPATGVELMVVNNTSRNFINGAFSNLPQGQPVRLSQGGLVHSFVANYYGGTGNDLVLVWAETRVVSWGANSNGELGDGSESDRQAPVLVSDAASASALFGKTVLSVSAGGGHSLALCSDGSIAAWGGNSSGQLGNNSSGPSYLPITVSTDESGSYLFGKRVVAVSAGYSHSLALCSDGTVAAWGSNYNGALGDGSAESRSFPVAVYAADNDSALFGKTVVAISAGNGHSLALCSDGTVAGWGEFGGNEGGSRLIPIAVSNSEGSALFGRSVVAISAGGSHNLALCSDGVIAAWGSNSFGQLGGEPGNNLYNPIRVMDNEGSALTDKTVVAVSAGDSHSLALCSDGVIAAWGSNSFGQLGNSSVSVEGSFYPIAVSTERGESALFGKTAVAVTAGWDHSLARCSDGTVAAWGGNGRGQLGDNTIVERHDPVEVNSDEGVSALFGRRAMHFSAGNQHNLALAAAPSTTPVPTVAFEQAASTVPESAGTVTVEVSLSGPAPNDITVPFTVSGTATSADATVAAPPLVIPAGASNGFISVVIADDTLYENAETVILTLGTPTGAGQGSTTRHTLTLTDNEQMPTVAFAQVASTAVENAGTVTVTVALSGPSSSNITVPFTVSGTATGADATVAAPPLVIPAGASGGTIAVTITDDTLYENAETVILTLGTPTGAGLSTLAQHTLTITDNEAVPTVAFAQAASTAGENGGAVTVAVALSGPSSSNITVPFTVSGTATGADAAVASSPLVIPAGASGGTIAVTITDDVLHESAETVILALGTPSGAGLGATIRHTLTITDNEGAPTVAFAQAASKAGENAGTLTVEVALSGASSMDITVPFTVSGTASSADATVAASPLMIPAGASGGTISVAITDDTLYENAETVVLTLGTPSGAGLGSTVLHTLTITDNEAVPTVIFAQASSTAGESAGTVAVAMALSGASSMDITVPFTVSGTASSADATVAASPLMIPAGASGGTISVAITDDTLYENAETVVLTLGTPSGAGLGSTVLHTLTITDNEAVPTVTFAQASSTARESAVTVTMEVALSGPSASEITVPFTVSGTATGGDATVASSPLVIPAGAPGGTISVAITDDMLYESAETVILTLGTPSGAGLGSTVQHTLTITDNEGVPTVAFTEVSSTAGENAGTVTVAVALSGPSSSEITVPFTVAGTASGSDAMVAVSPLVIPAGASGGTIAVTITDDTLYESPETLALILGTPSGAGLGSPVRHTLTITDNEEVPTVAFAEAASTVGESAGTVTVAVVLSGSSASEITVPFTVAGTATGADVTVAVSPLVIPAGASGGTIAVTVTDDNLYEHAETVALTLGIPSGAGLGSEVRHTLTITDNEGVPTVAFAEASSTVGENAGTVTVEVALSGRSSTDVTVPFTVSGTATGADAAVASSPLMIPAGASGGTISVAITDDTLYENAETVILTLGTPSGAGLGSVARHTLTITDNEGAPTVAFAQAVSTAGENAGTVTVAVTLSGSSASDITVPYAVSGTATAADATVAASPLVIPAGASGGTIAVTITDDTLYESAESVILTLGTPSGAGLGSVVRHTLTITDNEGAPTVAFAQAVSTAGENAGTLAVAVALSGPSSSDITVPFTISGTATGTDAAVAASPLVIPAGASGGSISVTVTDDTLYESAETVILTLGTPSGAGLGSVGQHTLTITDNEAAPIVAFAEIASTAGESAGTVTAAVTLSGRSASEITVPFTVSGTATGGDATVASSPLVIPAGAPGGTISVAITDDMLYESAETVILALDTPSGAGLGSAVRHTLTITDNDPQPSVSLAAGGALTENDGPATATVSLNTPSGLPVTVNLTTGGSAGGNVDYTVSGTTVTIPAGVTDAAFTVTPINDKLPEGDETIALTLTNPVNAQLGNPSARTIVLTDDNDAALNVLSATSSGPVTEGGAAALTFKVALARAGDGPVSVQYSFSGTATPGMDFTGAGGMLTFTGSELEKTVSVNVLDDSVFEPAETVILTLSAPSGGVTGNGTAVGSILEDDPMPVIALSDAGTMSDAGPDAVSAVFHVQLSGPSATAVTLPWNLVGGSARAGEDFIGGSGVLTFNPGITSSRIQVPIITDNLIEGAEAFALQPGNPEGAVMPGSGERWFLSQTLPIATEAGSLYGQTSSMHEDVLAVAAPEGNGGKGEVLVFSRTSSGWEGPQARLSHADGVLGDVFGHSVAVWGEWLVAGAVGRDGAVADTGAAYIFRRSRDGWTQFQRLDAPGARESDYFGWAVAIHKTTLAVSSRLRTTGKGPRGNEGAVYVYDLVDGVWKLSREITAEGTTVQSLGGSLALFGDTLAAGAPDDDTLREDAGAVYLFERNAGGAKAWGQVGKFQNAGGPALLQHFGGAVSLWGKTLAVGSAGGSAVNIFDKTPAGAWENTAVLHWNQAIPTGNFSSSLHLSGDTLAVGAPRAGGVAGEGSLYFYQRSATREWSQVQLLDGSTVVPGGGFSAGVAGWGGEFAVGSVEGSNGKTHILRSTWATAFLDEEPAASGVILQPGAGGMVLSWNPVSGALRYEVEGSDDLLNWESLADVYPPAVSWTVPAGFGNRMYFRIRCRF